MKAWRVGLGLAAVLFGCGGSGPVRFTVLLEQADGLQAGAPVIHRETEIGRVVQVDGPPGKISVQVEIPPENQPRLYREAIFKVAADSTGNVRLLVEDREGRRTQLEDGDEIDMRPGWFEKLSDQLQKAGDSARSALTDLKTGVEQAVDSFEKSPEFKEFKDRLSEAGRDAASLARMRYEQFLETDLPKLEQKASAYRDKLIKEGRKEEAEIFWKWFQRWSEALKKAGREEEPPKAEEEPGGSSG